jgi:hypothetical protein
MPSPFPGMDPYLERHWGDVHSSVITFAKVALQRQLGGGLVARSEERVYIDDEDPLRRQARVPDVRVIERGGASDVPVRTGGGVAVAEPVVFEVATDPTTERFVQISDATLGGRVVTVVESSRPPTNSTRTPASPTRTSRASASKAAPASSRLT